MRNKSSGGKGRRDILKGKMLPMQWKGSKRCTLAEFQNLPERRVNTLMSSKMLYILYKSGIIITGG
jgi:hypothetical protein